MDIKQIEVEKRSAAVSLSDMEIFVFPEIMYALVLANILSPQIWQWLDEPWFADIDSQKPAKKLQRLRQYIMDNYSFNLDLDTWGLTTREKELERFNDFIDPEILRSSNALFGYEGDKYYFDMDIRRHFGLDKYTDETIPYWKTETVEAMTAFKYKEGYDTGAGECVSLAALWAAALFIVCKVPLEDIFMMATPLHSQNFLLSDNEGTITNNRRIVTKNMWVNGTELSAKARRALQNERVTIVSHISGYVHIMYGEATISPEQYQRFTGDIKKFLHFNITTDMLSNFLRWKNEYMRYFQVSRNVSNKCGGFIKLERLFSYEHGSNFSVTGPSRKKLFDEVDCEEYYPNSLEDRMVLNDFEDWLRKNHPDPKKSDTRDLLIKNLVFEDFPAEQFVDELIEFCYIDPKLPDLSGKSISQEECPIKIDRAMCREEIRQHLLSLKDKNKTAEYTFYALRDLTHSDHEPFLRAAVNRNPVAVEVNKELSYDDIYGSLVSLPAESVYAEEFRLAQPDEVWNYQRGDGLEKALVLADIIHQREPELEIQIRISGEKAVVTASESSLNFEFSTNKSISPDGSEVIWVVDAVN